MLRRGPAGPGGVGGVGGPIGPGGVGGVGGPLVVSAGRVALEASGALWSRRAGWRWGCRRRRRAGWCRRRRGAGGLGGVGGVRGARWRRRPRQASRTGTPLAIPHTAAVNLLRTEAADPSSAKLARRPYND